MKVIQWYPGHMAKAMRMMEEQISLSDAVVFVLDARCPASSFNQKLLSLTGTKPVLFAFNKWDLTDRPVAEALLTAVKRSGRLAVPLISTAPASARALRTAMEQAVREKAERMRARGLSRPMRFMIAGIPNTGKSTLINLIAGSKRAQTGDQAGVTRAKQWVRCGSFELLDTPGTMPPSCENQLHARRLAYVGSINDDILAIDEIALSLLEDMAAAYPEALSERYGIAPDSPLSMLEGVCRRRGLVTRGGEFDYERGERAAIDDFRKGRLGGVCFDTLEDLREVGLAE